MLLRWNFVFIIIIIYGLCCGVALGQEDTLSSILQRMEGITAEKSACPHSLSKYNLTIPDSLLNTQFHRETAAVRRLARLLNSFLSYHVGTGVAYKESVASKFQTVEQVARSAVNLLLESEVKIKRTHVCWIKDASTATAGAAGGLGNMDNFSCRYFLRSTSSLTSSASADQPAVLITSAPATGSSQVQPAISTAHPATAQSIREKEKNSASLIRDVLQSNTLLRNEFQAGWTAPYFDCSGSWLITYLVLVNNRKDATSESGSHIPYGTFGMDIDLLAYVDINQCSDDEHHENIFRATHRCKLQTTICHNISGYGFRRGGYRCACQPGHYSQSVVTEFSGADIERTYAQSEAEYAANFNCFRCAPDCTTCTDGNPCVVTYDIVARGLPLGVLAFCITCALFVAAAVYRYRRRKVIASATWPLLENIIMGGILVYCSVIIRYFPPTFERCMAEPWLRELGFMLFYCAVILKLYKVVTEFRTRKAHCVYVRDKDLVKYHIGIILITIAFMSAWTSISMDLHREGKEILLTLVSTNRRRHTICRLPWWDYVAESCETLILLWGIYLSYLARNSKTLYMERKLLTAAICVELLVSGIFYIIRHAVWYDVHPDVIYLLYFGRSQLTITVNLFVIFGGKIWYIFRPQDDPFRKNQAQGTQGRPAEMEKLHDGIFAGDLELNQIPLANMDHGEIRMELRRLYAQMQVLKTKAMRQDNPHISKKKGGRKMPHRRFSIQAFSSRTRHPKYDEETTAVKTPEESSGSVDNYHADAPTTIYEDEPYNSPLHSAVANVVNSVINKKGTNQHVGVTNL
ncbi:probable G-protein coupled receptor 158 [Paramacrobiotus metropolitanus]|uniref:probable G-protein coupled receptor 158 n=1 Tax=Paramacrobiotus metropolitanus TaxID=2943436 RepID=UPI002445826B|nr:probable G-protein coupled receptor 158 [Paramacrobiotus metropolitanus]